MRCRALLRSASRRAVCRLSPAWRLRVAPVVTTSVTRMPLLHRSYAITPNVDGYTPPQAADLPEADVVEAEQQAVGSGSSSDGEPWTTADEEDEEHGFVTFSQLNTREFKRRMESKGQPPLSKMVMLELPDPKFWNEFPGRWCTKALDTTELDAVFGEAVRRSEENDPDKQLPDFVQQEQDGQEGQLVGDDGLTEQERLIQKWAQEEQAKAQLENSDAQEEEDDNLVLRAKYLEFEDPETERPILFAVEQFVSRKKTKSGALRVVKEDTKRGRIRAATWDDVTALFELLEVNQWSTIKMAKDLDEINNTIATTFLPPTGFNGIEGVELLGLNPRVAFVDLDQLGVSYTDTAGRLKFQVTRDAPELLDVRAALDQQDGK